jgi:hypothetical protein
MLSHNYHSGAAIYQNYFFFSPTISMQLALVFFRTSKAQQLTTNAFHPP